MSIKKHIPKLLGATFVVAVGVGITWLIYSSMHAEPVKQKKQVQQITLVKPPPPPPPPPKQERPPPPEVKEEVNVSEPEQIEEMPDVADAPPAGDLLGLDAEGGAGADGFGLIARKGGRGLLSGAGDPNVVYATQLQRMIEEALAEDEKTRSRNYSIIAKVWIGFDGSVTRAELASSTGKDDIDDSLLQLIQQLPALAEAPPPNMPQPIRMRISSRL